MGALLPQLRQRRDTRPPPELQERQEAAVRRAPRRGAEVPPLALPRYLSFWGHGGADPTGGGGPGVSAPCRPAACPEHTLQGTVVSATGAALPGARIYLEGRPPVLVARSDTRGSFHVAGVCEGTAANVSAHRDGFVPGLAPITSNGSGVSVAHVTLQKLGEHRGTGGCTVRPSGSCTPVGA